MSSCTAMKVNRRNVRRVVAEGGITGVDLATCASAVMVRMGCTPKSHRKVLEQLEGLVRDSWIVLQDAIMTARTDSERRTALRVQTDEAARIRRTRARTATKRKGGFRRLPVENLEPLAA